MAQTANEAILDLEVSHAIDIQRYANAVARDSVAELNRSDAELSIAVLDAVQRVQGETPQSNMDEAAMAAILAILLRSHAAVERNMRAQMPEFVALELERMARMLRRALPAPVRDAVRRYGPGSGLATSQILADHVQGRTLAEWIRDMASARYRSIRDRVLVGATGGESEAQTVAAIRGTRAAGFADGVLQTGRRNIETLAHSIVTHVSASASDLLLRANEAIIGAVEWRAILDSRTSEGCRIRDGKHYTILGHRPIGHAIPWMGGPGRLHWNCRSIQVPVFRALSDLGEQYQSSSEALMAAMDGRRASDVSFAQWIEKQDPGLQDDVLGPTRAKMLRSGAKLESFYDSRGRYLTLEELRQRMPVED